MVLLNNQLHKGKSFEVWLFSSDWWRRGKKTLIGFLYCIICKNLQLHSFYIPPLNLIMTASFLPSLFFLLLFFFCLKKNRGNICVALYIDRYFGKQIFRHLIWLESPSAVSRRITVVWTSSLLCDLVLVMWSIEPRTSRPEDIMLRNIPGATLLWLKVHIWCETISSSFEVLFILAE